MESQKKKPKAKKKKECEHDFLAIIHCKKCGEQYHVKWLDALVEVKLSAVEDVFRRVQTTLKVKSQGEDQKRALEIARKAFDEVKDVYIEMGRKPKPKN